MRVIPRMVLLLPALLVMHAPDTYAAKPYIETGPDAEKSFDGLYRVKRSRMGAAWVRDGLNLSRYHKLLVRGAGIAYQPTDWSGNATSARLRGETDFPITPENREKLAAALREEVMEELAKGKRYELAEEPGDDVLLLTVGLIDVVSHVPDERPGRSDIYLQSVGEATLVLELRDSVTGAILARAGDRRAASSPYFQRSNSVTTTAEVKRLGSSWGRLLRDRLDDLMSTSGELAAGKP